MAQHSTFTSLDKARSYAQYFTVTVAAIDGLFWFITSVILNNTSDNVTTINGVMTGAVAAGGLLMGLLYIAAKAHKN